MQSLLRLWRMRRFGSREFALKRASGRQSFYAIALLALLRLKTDCFFRRVFSTPGSAAIVIRSPRNEFPVSAAFRRVRFAHDSEACCLLKDR